MISLHPHILKQHGRGQFVILSYQEYEAIRELLADADDLATLRRARQADDRSKPGYTLEQVRVRLGLRPPRTPLRRPRTPRRKPSGRR